MHLRSRPYRHFLWGGLATLAAIALVTATEAQPGLGARGGSGARPSKPGGSRPQTPRAPRVNVPSGTGVITKFTPAKNRDSETAPLGTLAMRLDDQRSVQLQVPATLKVMLGNKQFEGEDLEQLLTAGLPLSVNWDEKKEKNRKTNVLVSATVPLLEIEAEIEKYDGKADAVILTAWPKPGNDWPDIKNKQTTPTGKVIKRKIRLRGIELASEIRDDADRPITVQDMEPTCKCYGTIVYCRPANIAVNIKVLALGKNFNDPPGTPGGPSGPSGGGGGPRRLRGGGS